MARYEDFYTISSMDGLLGNDAALSKLRMFASDIDNGRVRAPLLVYGPSGTGKTAAVHLLAAKHGWNVVEMGANDHRDALSIKRKLSAASMSRSIFGKRNVIVLDEIDELAARFDKGAASAINALMKDARNPIIFVANDMWDRSITFLRGKTDPVQFRRLPADTMAKLLQGTCRRIGLHVDTKQIEMISLRSNGDARSALNDLFTIADSADDATEVLGMRNKKIDIFALLDRIFFSHSASAPLKAIMGTDLSNDMLISWLDENIPKRYLGAAELRKAFDSLSMATVFSSRALRSQYYAYWRYMNVFMSSGVSLAKDAYPDSRYRYMFPQKIKALSLTKTARHLRAGLAAKLQRRFHASVADISRSELSVIAEQATNEIKSGRAKPKEIVDELMSVYGLDEKEAKSVIKLHAA